MKIKFFNKCEFGKIKFIRDFLVGHFKYKENYKFKKHCFI